MSSSLLAGITQEATCHVRTLADTSHWSFALTSTSVDKLTASPSAVAILYDRSSEDDMQRALTIWTLRGKIPIRCLTRPHHLTGGQKSQRETKIMIGAKTDCIVVFEECFCDGWRIYFTRFDFDGQFQSQGFLQAPDTTSLTEPPLSSTFSDPDDGATICLSSTSSDPDDGATIWSYCHCSAEEGSVSSYVELTRVQYDPQQDKLQLKTHRIMRKWWPRNPKDIFIWKDIAYYEEHNYTSDVPPRLMMIDLSENEIKRTVSMGEFHRSGFGSDPNFSFFGDENFLVSVCGSRFQAWSFNKRTEMTNGKVRYALYRRGRMDRRLEMQRAWDAEVMARVLRKEQINLEVTGSVGNYHAFQQTES